MDCPNCQQPAESSAPDRLVCKTCGPLVRDAKGEWHVDEAKTVPVEPAVPADPGNDLPSPAKTGPVLEDGEREGRGSPGPTVDATPEAGDSRSDAGKRDGPALHFELWDGDR